MKKLIPIIAVSVILFLIVGYFTFNYTVKKITEREVKRITQQEIDRITKEETDKINQSEIDKITDEIINQRTKEITKQMMGDNGETETLETKCDLKPKQREFSKSPYYEGPLIDNHVHLPVASKIVSEVAMQSGFKDMPYVGDIPIGSIACIFESEGIKNAYGFFLMPNAALSSSVQSAKNTKEKYPNQFIPFFMPPPIASLHPDISDVEKTILSSKGVFKGIGEIAVYHYPSDVKLDDSYFLELYRIADENKLIVMIHPRPGEQEAVEKIVKAYPNVKFLFHGEAWVADLFDKYPNIYFSVDATGTHIYGTDAVHKNRKLTKEEWLAYFRENFDSSLNEVVGKWKAKIEKHPDRFLWGTDRWYSWHFDYEVGGLIEEFSRSFIGQLDPKVQEKFAYKNAENLISQN